MLIQTAPRSLTTSEVEVTGTYGIRPQDAPHIMRILRDTMYTDRILAVVREYGANAWDAHREAGLKDKPVKVTLPSSLYPFFSIRDYGSGLSEEDVIVLYTQYGASTKRGSNEAVGGLGIGNKSGFAYSTSFTVTSWFQGSCSCYSAVLDENDVGQMVKLAETPCDASETGLQISVPVRAEDYVTFKARAESTYQFFEPRPEGMKFSQELTRVTDHLSLTATAANRDYHYVRMGCIAYPLPETVLRSYSGKTFVFDMPIGSVPIAANRESLKLTDASQAEIRKQIKEILLPLFEAAKEKLVPTYPKTYQALLEVQSAKSIGQVLGYLSERTNGYYRGDSYDLPSAPKWDAHTLYTNKFKGYSKYGSGAREYNGGLHEYLGDFDKIVLLGRDVAPVYASRELEIMSTKDIEGARQRLDDMLVKAGLTGIPIEVRGKLEMPPRKKRAPSTKPKVPKKEWAVGCCTYNRVLGEFETSQENDLSDPTNMVYMNPRSYEETGLSLTFAALVVLFGDSAVLPTVVYPKTTGDVTKVRATGVEEWHKWAENLKNTYKVAESDWSRINQQLACSLLRRHLAYSNGFSNDLKNVTFRWNRGDNHPLRAVALETFGSLEPKMLGNVDLSFAHLGHVYHGDSLPPVNLTFGYNVDPCFPNLAKFNRQFESQIQTFIKAVRDHYFIKCVQDSRGYDWLVSLVESQSDGNTSVTRYQHIMDLTDELVLLRASAAQQVSVQNDSEKE